MTENPNFENFVDEKISQGTYNLLHYRIKQAHLENLKHNMLVKDSILYLADKYNRDFETIKRIIYKKV